MSKLYLISDLHLGHENIAKKRGFNSSDEHDEYIITQWNKIVKKRDIVCIPGDITMEKSEHYHKLDRLNGLKKVILGNHDKPSHVLALLKHVNSVCGILKYKGFWISHAPIHPTELRGLKNIHGHVHDGSSRKLKRDKRYINVCAEVLNYKPILFDDIKNQHDEKRNNGIFIRHITKFRKT